MRPAVSVNITEARENIDGANVMVVISDDVTTVTASSALTPSDVALLIDDLTSVLDTVEGEDE